MPANQSKSGGTVIQGSFQNGALKIFQALLATASSRTGQGKAPLPLSEQTIQTKTADQAKGIAPPPIRWPNHTSTAQTKTADQAKLGAPPSICFPGQPPIPVQTKPSTVSPVPAPVRFPVPLSQPTVQVNTLHSKTIQPKAIQLSGGGRAFQVPATLNVSSPSGGFRLPEAIQKKMEAFFKTSFDDVRVHIGPQAASLGALAFTHGSNLYFAPGQYNPTTMQGQRLLGHELAHVVQQRTGRVKNAFGSGIAVIRDGAMEAEADRMGQQVALSRIDIQAHPGSQAIQRRSGGRFGRLDPELLLKGFSPKSTIRVPVERATPRNQIVQLMEAPPEEEISALILSSARDKLSIKDGRLRFQGHIWNTLKQISFRRSDVASYLRENGYKSADAVIGMIEKSQCYKSQYKATILQNMQKEEEQGKQSQQQEEVVSRYRRMEDVARLLETDENRCVAICMLANGTILATTNKGPIAKISFDPEKGLGYAGNVSGVQQSHENPITEHAQKLATFLHQDENVQIARAVNKIIQVQSREDDRIHAELKLLDYLFYNDVGGSGPFTIYISRKCCPRCRKAIDIWNRDSSSYTKPKIKVQEGSHSSSYLWKMPQCIWGNKTLRKAVLDAMGIQNPSDLLRGEESTSVTVESQRRPPSPIPRRKGPQVPIFQIPTEQEKQEQSQSIALPPSDDRPPPIRSSDPIPQSHRSYGSTVPYQPPTYGPGYSSSGYYPSTPYGPGYSSGYYPPPHYGPGSLTTGQTIPTYTTQTYQGPGYYRNGVYDPSGQSGFLGPGPYNFG